MWTSKGDITTVGLNGGGSSGKRLLISSIYMPYKDPKAKDVLDLLKSTSHITLGHEQMSNIFSGETVMRMLEDENNRPKVSE